MKPYLEMTKEEKEQELSALKSIYESERAKGYKLDLTRGKPSSGQLELSMDMLRIPPEELIYSENGLDVRNYGTLPGIEEARRFVAELMGVKPGNVIVGGAASLNLMYDCIMRAFVFGVYGGSKPWGQQGKLKFLCPAPGYDRHFRITEHFGFELITIPMTDNGPDMDMVKEYVENDASVKGIWCVPKYSNPLGTTYSPETVEKFAALKPAADDFRIFWDNAYCIQCFREPDDYLAYIFDVCKKYGSEDMVYEFFSTSKITFPGAGMSAMIMSEANIKHTLKYLTAETISYDKLNMLRHVRFLKNVDNLKAFMKKHAEFLAPRFDAVIEELENGIGETGAGTWTNPNGGYFISFTGLPGTAARAASLCAEAGVNLTGAGATYPYGKDPNNNNIRLCPSYPPLDDLHTAIKVFCLCERIATLEVLLAE